VQFLIDLLYFPIPATIIVGLIAWVFLWRKDRKLLAILAIPIFWIILITFMTAVIFFLERQNDLDRKPFIPIDKIFERNVNTHETRIEFYKFIKTKKYAYLMAKVSIDSTSTASIIDQRCIELSYSTEQLSNPQVYRGVLFDKGLGPLTPADPDNAHPLVWFIPPDVISTTDPLEIAQNLNVEISSFWACHTIDGGIIHSGITR